MDLSNLLPLLVAAAVGALLALGVITPFLLAYKRDAKGRTLRHMVKEAAALAKQEDDADPVALAKRKAEERALVEQLQAAVAKLTPPAG